MKKFLKYVIWLIAFLLTIIIFIVSINVYIIKYSNRYIIHDFDDSLKVDAVLIPGARVYSTGHVSLMLADRLETAMKVYTTKQVMLIVSGGEGEDGYNEVDAMERYLKSRYVLPEYIIKDFDGYNTFASIDFVTGHNGIQSVIISTQKYHLYRAIFIARKKGIEAYGIAADMHKYPGMEYYRFRESLARIKDFLLIVFS